MSDPLDFSGQRVLIVGAGIIGLSTAVTLQERGHTVRVVAAAVGDATTSAVAAAIWNTCKP